MDEAGEELRSDALALMARCHLHAASMVTPCALVRRTTPISSQSLDRSAASTIVRLHWTCWLCKQKLMVAEWIALVYDATSLLEPTLGVKRTRPGFRVKGIQANGISWPCFGCGARILNCQAPQPSALMCDR